MGEQLCNFPKQPPATPTIHSNWPDVRNVLLKSWMPSKRDCLKVCDATHNHLACRKYKDMQKKEEAFMEGSMTVHNRHKSYCLLPLDVVRQQVRQSLQHSQASTTPCYLLFSSETQQSLFSHHWLVLMRSLQTSDHFKHLKETAVIFLTDSN